MVHYSSFCCFLFGFFPLRFFSEISLFLLLSFSSFKQLFLFLHSILSFVLICSFVDSLLTSCSFLCFFCWWHHHLYPTPAENFLIHCFFFKFDRSSFTTNYMKFVKFYLFFPFAIFIIKFSSILPTIFQFFFAYVVLKNLLLVDFSGY